jgi:hypothetical protein
MTRTYAAPLTHSDLELTLRSAIRASFPLDYGYTTAQLISKGRSAPQRFRYLVRPVPSHDACLKVLKSFEVALGPFIRRNPGPIASHPWSWERIGRSSPPPDRQA